ncbi:MAG: hypothetical protein V7K89_07695 [Nostoc sp.]
MAQTTTVTAAGDNNIDGLLIGVKWASPSVRNGTKKNRNTCGLSSLQLLA